MASFTHLSYNGLDVEQGYSLVLAPNDELEKVVAEHFKHHANVRAIDARDFKVVKELDRLLPFGVRFVTVADAAKEFDFVQRRFRIV